MALNSGSFAAVFNGAVSWTRSGALAKQYWDEFTTRGVPIPKRLILTLLCKKINRERKRGEKRERRKMKKKERRI
jgi:hypothetical protein